MGKGQAIIVDAPDAIAMRDRVVKLINEMNKEGDSIDIVEDRLVPDTWDNVVILFLATPGAFADRSLADHLRNLDATRLPIVPIVDDFARFDFRSVPPEFAVIGDRNSKGLEPDHGESVKAAIRQNLGLESKNRMRKVFISYRRADAADQAGTIEAELWRRKCMVFLDTQAIEGGALVQEVIIKSIKDMDFVLFIDSPAAAASVAEARWITEELNTALLNRIPVAVVRLDPPKQHITMLGPVPSIDWDRNDVCPMEKIFRMVSRGIASRSSLDDRIERSLPQLAKSRGFELRRDPRDGRRFELIHPDQPMIRLEYEDAGITLERLHRLYRWYEETHDGEIRAVFVCGDYLILPPTRDAIAWACGRYPLQVFSIAHLVEFLQTTPRSEHGSVA